MRRWNGWGEESVVAQVPEAALTQLAGHLGPGQPGPDAPWPEVVAAVPASRLPAHPLVTTEPAPRMRYAAGQSLPDWIALRSGRLPAFPDGVAFPESEAEVRELLAFAASVGARLIPYGGGTSVVGHLAVPPGPRPVLTVSLARMSSLLDFDGRSRLAVFGAGIAGPDLEAQLRARGFTLGHFPQSFEYSTLGGWVATRSCGQESLGYGRIERLFAGGRIEAPAGRLDLPPLPASAAGPDLRSFILGSEGRFGILTQATVRITPVPETEEVHSVFFPEWTTALEALRRLAQARLSLSMLRLSTPQETETSLRLSAGGRRLVLLDRYLRWRGAGPEKCLLLLGLAGSRRTVSVGREEAVRLAVTGGGVSLGRLFEKGWRDQRFRAPYLRNALWERGYALDTLETAAPWGRIPSLLGAVETSLRDGLRQQGETVFVMSHLSHVYPDGASLYTTYLFRRTADPEEMLSRWRALKTSASEAILAQGGTISHQHGVGRDHLPFLAREIGPLGVAALGSAARVFDPDGIMNPGALVA